MPLPKRAAGRASLGQSSRITDSFAGAPARGQRLLRLHVVAEQYLLVTDIELAIGDDRVRPRRRPAAVGLRELAALDVLLRARLDEQHGTAFGAVVQSAVRHRHRALLRPALVPQDLAGLEIEAVQVTSPVATVSAVKATVDDDHASVVVLHRPGEVDLLGLDAVPVLDELHQPAARAVSRGGE